MATKKMTFTIVEDVAEKFLRRVPAQDRSRYVSEAIAAKLREREDRLIRACEIANAEPDVLMIEQEWEALDAVEGIEAPWVKPPSNDAPAR